MRLRNQRRGIVAGGSGPEYSMVYESNWAVNVDGWAPIPGSTWNTFDVFGNNLTMIDGVAMSDGGFKDLGAFTAGDEIRLTVENDNSSTHPVRISLLVDASQQGATLDIPANTSDTIDRVLDASGTLSVRIRGNDGPIGPFLALEIVKVTVTKKN